MSEEGTTLAALEQDDIIDVLDDYRAMQAELARGVNGAYCGYVYGEIVTNEIYDRRRAEVLARLRSVILQIVKSEPVPSPPVDETRTVPHT